MKLIMQNKANLSKSQMFITLVKTMNYSEKSKMDTWSKQTQSKPILKWRKPPLAAGEKVVSADFSSKNLLTT
jgi:hypothetical protein